MVTNQNVMKFVISLLLICLSFGASASDNVSSTIKKDAAIETIIGFDRGKKNKRNRRNKRINKKRKRKCAKWGRKSYAG